ncbi:Scd6-like Sm domain-containing protein [Podospora fimiseda]|uniref:Scd6-like Sm domain-containing protein n=1 Tax=Podospora fimiseda TaxID=252190 RepID=A0AAN7H166_9PEZI|nr:Scd6-like Sm domain-containing protein [Podospora fimiseda]
MSEFLGSRISLISKSDIRYVGTLASINSDDSTVSLENVKSFGTEGRRGNPDDELPPSDQIYEYIVFRGTDVKDLRIEEGPSAKENKPPAVPNDPAIVGARARPGNVAPGPQGPPQGPPQGAPQGPPGPGPIGHPGPHGPGNQQAPPPFFPPPYMGGGGWGRGGPSPGPGGPFGGMPYPPHPGWFPPPGQEFPPMGPGGPGPWNYGGFPPGPGGPGGPGAPPGLAGAPGAPGQGRQSATQTPSNQGPSQKPAPIGPAADKKPTTPSQRSQPPPAEPKIPSQAPRQVLTPSGPPPPVESKPTVEEVKATAASLSAGTTQNQESKGIPTGPKSDRPAQILPAIPLPIGLTAKAAQSSTKPVAEQNSAATAAALRDATQAAKEAVAIAMAKMESTITQQSTQGAAVDNLTKKVNEMRVNAAAPRGGQNSRGGTRGRGGPRPAAKVEVPDSDFDFATANAKFNKQELVTGTPLAETANGDLHQSEAVAEAEQAEPAYNKSRSFFDNISSDLKDRENATQKPGGREWRGEEQRKNMETFGQGSVDGGYRGYRGGRGGRGRGGRGGRGYRGGRGGNNGYRPRDNQQAPAQ